MTYRKVANWEIDIGDRQEETGWRRTLGISQFTQEFGIRANDREIRIKKRTMAVMTLDQIETALPLLAHACQRNLEKEHQRGKISQKLDLIRDLEGLGVKLPSWLVD